MDTTRTPRSDATETPSEMTRLFAGKFRVERAVGRGGVGVVFEATHLKMDMRVALKLLLPRARRDRDARARFAREARAAAKIGGDHVVRVFDVGELETGVPYMVMEFLDGSDLGDFLATRGALSVEEAVHYVLQICDALAGAHELGIVHRDLKPANIFIARRPDGSTTVKVVDFGLSKIPPTARGDGVTTDSEFTMGTIGWMSPEQMRSLTNVDARSDIWSLGAIFYEMLTGKPPYVFETAWNLYAVALSAPPEAPSKTFALISREVDEIVLKCMQYDPEARFQNVAELARALAPFAPPVARKVAERIEHGERAARDRGVPALPFPRRPTNFPRKRMTPDADAARGSSAMTSRPPPSRAPWLAVPIAIVVAIVAAVATGSRSPAKVDAVPSASSATAPPDPPPPSVAIATVNAPPAPTPSPSTSATQAPPRRAWPPPPQPSAVPTRKDEFGARE